MTNEELCKRIQNGDVDLLGQLLEQNRGMIHIFARKYAGYTKLNGAADYDDLVQSASLGMMLAVDKWEAPRGPFLSIAKFYMRKSIRQTLGIDTSKRYVENTGRVVCIDEPLKADEGSGITITEMIADESAVDPAAACVESDVAARLRAAIRKLPPAIQESVTRAYYYGGEWTTDKGERSRVLTGIDRLKRNRDLKKLRREYRATCYRHKGVKAFNSSWSSPVEDAVIYRERLRAEIEKHRAEATAIREQLRILRTKR